MKSFFVSDLHGHLDRYRKLFDLTERERPDAVFLGGDLLPLPALGTSSSDGEHGDFITDYLAPEFSRLRESMAGAYPRVFLILGNDDGRLVETAVREAADLALWEYVHGRYVEFDGFSIYGYAYVPPTPFLCKDWERYDVSRYVDPGAVSPEEGVRSISVSDYDKRYATIANDLDRLAGGNSLDRALFLFHSPPYRTSLDRAALDGKAVDYAPVDVHVGSVAIRRFIEERQPLLTLHGHIHESARLTGTWQERLGRTFCFTAAHDGPELALVRFDPVDPGRATRDLI